MGKLKSALEDWLDDIGYSLGYDMENYPDFSQWDKIKIKNGLHHKEMDNCNCSGGLLHTRPSFFSK